MSIFTIIFAALSLFALPHQEELEKCLETEYGVNQETVPLIVAKLIPLAESPEVIREFLSLSHTFTKGDPSSNKTLFSSDALLAAPENHEVLFESEKFRILYAMTKAHERENAHTHQWKSLMIITKGSCFRIENSDGSIEDGDWPVGVYEIPGESAPSGYLNTGLEDFENVRFELK